MQNLKSPLELLARVRSFSINERSVAFSLLQEYISSVRKSFPVTLSPPEDEGEDPILKSITAVSVLSASYVRHLASHIGEKRRNFYDDQADVDDAEKNMDDEVVRLQGLLESFTSDPEAFPSQEKYRERLRSILSYGLDEIEGFQKVRYDDARRVLMTSLSNSDWNVRRVESIVISMNRHRPHCRPETTRRARDPLEATKVTLSLIDPFLRTPIQIPARGSACTHLDVFDLYGFLSIMNQKSVSSVNDGETCPFCQKKIRIYDIVIDRRVWDCLQSCDTGKQSGTRSAYSLEWDLVSDTIHIVKKEKSRVEEEDVAANDDDNGSVEAERSQMKKRKLEIDGQIYFLED